MKKLSELIVKYRFVIAVIFIAIVITSACFIPKVGLNYDLTKYLDDNSSTVKALNVMEEEFGSSGTAQILIENVEVSQAEALAKNINSIEGVNTVVFDGKDVNFYNAEKKSALFKIFLQDGNFEPEAHSTIQEIRNELSEYTISLNGMATDSAFLQKAVSDDMTIILIIACIVIIGILFLSSTSWIDPLIFMFVIFCAIIINMGTNVWMGEISFITRSICAIMQMALAMDYSIILLHRFNECKANALDNKEAMREALAKTFSPVSASSLTTIAGLVALMFMRFTIGFDIGMVLAKGILISLLSVFLFMPCVILIFAKAVEKTQHRSLHMIVSEKTSKRRASRQVVIDSYNSERPAGAKAKRLHTFTDFQYNTRILIPIILLCLIILGAVMQPFMSYSYNLSTAKDSEAYINVENNNITDTFGNQNSVVILLPKNTKLSTQKYIMQKVQSYECEVDGKMVSPYNYANGLAASGIYEELTVAEIASVFKLPTALVTPVFIANGVTSDGTMQLYKVIKYISENNYAIKATQGTQNELRGILIQSQVNSKYDECNSAISMLESENYTRLIFNLDFPLASDNAFRAMESLNENLPKWYSESESNTLETKDNLFILSESMNFLEIKNTFSKDIQTINLISFFAIFLIILLTFRSLSIPAILTLTIQGAIWLTMSFFAMSQSPLFFVIYLVVMCIQMGATVDYAILFTSRYMEARKTMPKKTSMAQAFSASLPTILTSGSILVIAAFIVGMVSRVSIISSLGLLLSLGCLISIIFIIFALPQTVILCDKIIDKTTIKSLRRKKNI